ncbi:MAG: DUF1232 domain-containing protein [Candidatus Delongbacteria bacterium]|nr:DUF1232 domain-containing protein [Candidatus Delongbacteria bacterium]MCG2761446.1 DUF1232 domain-containing protein [Candidatus Delongbacteria bacterium]
MTENIPKVDPKEAGKELEKSALEAEILLKDKEKTESTIGDAMKKADSVRGSLERVWHQLQLMFSLVIDYTKGNYKEIPTKSIVLTVGAILYFLMPIDLIPDMIPVFGYLDDIAVIGLVIKQIGIDLEKYEEWKKSKV